MDDGQARAVKRKKIYDEDDEGVMDSERETWINIAMTSDCAKHLDQILTDHTATLVDDYKKKLFSHIYDQIGKDPNLAKDLERAIMVKNRKFTPCQVAVLAVLSLGIFFLIRPADDDAVLVMTKQGRVITLKMEREGILNGNAFTIIITFMKYLLMFVFAMSIPAMLMWIFLSGQASSGRIVKNFGEEYGTSEVSRLQIDDEMLTRIRKHYIIAAEVFCAFLAIFMIWLWSKCPSDYGNRFRESYTASSLSAGQFTVTGRKGHRKVVMRLYFGKYPTQSVLDTHGRLTGKQNPMVKPVPLTSLAATGGTGGGSRDAAKLKRPSPGVVTNGLIILLSVVTMLDTALNWMNRAMAANHMYKVGRFCAHAPPEESECTRAKCRAWAVEHGHEQGFCKTVEWHDNVHSKTQHATCAYYGKHMPCCGGCGIGEAMSFAEEGGWLAAFQEVLAVISDIGTLAFSFMAAVSAVSMETSADHFDITINQGKWREGMEITMNFDFTRPVAHDFFDMVFSMSRPENDGGNYVPVQDPSMRRSNNIVDEPTDEEKTPLTDSLAAAGVSNFKPDLDATSWDDFFDERGEVLATTADSLITVPVNCLGIDQKNEKIIAAWTEKPRLMMTNLMAPMVAASLLTFILIVCPETVSEDPIALPGFGTSAVGRILSALTMGFLIVCLCGLYHWVIICVNAVAHVVVVTDCRIFYIRHQAPFYCLCNCGIGLRVDCYRHDRGVNYGRVESSRRSLMQRLTCSPVIPGTVTLQDKFGVLQMDRHFGDIFSVFNVVSQLSPEGSAGFLNQFLEERDDLPWKWEETMEEVDAALETQPTQPGVVYIKKQPEDVAAYDAGLYLLTRAGSGSNETAAYERPIFHWSVKKAGRIDSPTNTTSDVVVTTGRVFLWTRTGFKRFDCRTSLCWGFCWCGFLSSLRSVDGLENSISFFTLDSMLGFSTMTKVQPPVWTDPTHTPVKFPAIDSFCDALTKFCTCRWDGGGEGDQQKGSTSWSFCPMRTSPRIKLFLMWRLRTGPQQADLIASVFPYDHKDFEDVDLWTSLGFVEAGGSSNNTKETAHSKKIAQLRAIMGAAQDVADASLRAAAGTVAGRPLISSSRFFSFAWCGSTQPSQ